jgi:hypothetical protein
MTTNTTTPTEAAETPLLNLLERFLNWLFPTYTHCVECGRELPEPSKVGICGDCQLKRGI